MSPAGIRARYALLLAVTVIVGVASRKVHLGIRLWDKSLGDILYAVAMLFAMGLVAPRARLAVLTAAAFGASLAIELFQLTGIPLAIAETPQWGFARWVLGTDFAWHDVTCYAVGALGAGVLARLALSDRPSRAP